MPDNKYNIEFFQGSTFNLSLTVKESNGALKDLTSHSARMQIRPSYSSNVATESLTTSNGEIVVNTSTSIIGFSLPAERTAAIKVNLGDGGLPPKTKYVYDIELVNDLDGNVSKLLFGEVTVYGEVTR